MKWQMKLGNVSAPPVCIGRAIAISSAFAMFKYVLARAMMKNRRYASQTTSTYGLSDLNASWFTSVFIAVRL